MPNRIGDVWHAVRERWASVFPNQKAVLWRRLLHQQEVCMATLAEVQAELASVNETITAERLEVQGKLSDLAIQVKALQDQIANGGAATAADLDSLVASIQAIKGGVGQISEPLV